MRWQKAFASIAVATLVQLTIVLTVSKAAAAKNGGCSPVAALKASLKSAPTAAEPRFDFSDFRLRLDSTYCKNCRDVLRIPWSRGRHIAEHFLPGRERKKPDLFSVLARGPVARNADDLLEVFESLRAKARTEVPTTMWTQSEGERFLRDLAANKLRPYRLTVAQNGNHAFDFEYMGNRVKVAFCGRTPCSTPGTRRGDVITVYPICGPNLVRIPSRRELTAALRSRPSANQPFARWYDQVSSSLPTLVPCPPSVH